MDSVPTAAAKSKKLKEGQTQVRYNRVLESLTIECREVRNGTLVEWTVPAKLLLDYAFLTRPQEEEHV